MSVPLLIAVNVALDAALLGGLAYALVRPSRLARHLHAGAPAPRPATARRRARRGANAQGACDWSVRTSRATA